MTGRSFPFRLFQGPAPSSAQRLQIVAPRPTVGLSGEPRRRATEECVLDPHHEGPCQLREPDEEPDE